MKNVLVMGAGMVSPPLVDYLLDKGYFVYLGDLDGSRAERVLQGRNHSKGIALDIGNLQQVRDVARDVDLVISLLPPKFHLDLAQICLDLGKHFLTASYLSPVMEALHDQAHAKGLIFMNEIGVDPGLDHVTAMNMIDTAKDDGYQIIGFDSHCGGIPSKDAANNPLRYKFSWSPAGVLRAITRTSRFQSRGHVVQVPGREKLHHAEVLHIPGLGIFESLPNADSLYYGERYGLEGAQTIRRGTLRYPGWSQFWLFMLSLDFLDERKSMSFEDEQVLCALFKVAGWTPPEDIFTFVHEKADTHASVFLEAMESLGLLDQDQRISGTLSAFDIILHCAQQRLNYQQHETDLLVLHHELMVEKAGRKERWSSTLSREGIPEGTTAMAFLVGVPAAIAARMILENQIQERGILLPISRSVYKPILDELIAMGLPHETHRTPLTD